jgi:FeS assembly protein IscX
MIDTFPSIPHRFRMADKLTWRDNDDLAYALIDKFPEQDPLKLSFPKLHKMVIELEEFGDDPTKSTESILEAIQMAWYEEVK